MNDLSTLSALVELAKANPRDARIKVEVGSTYKAYDADTGDVPRARRESISVAFTVDAFPDDIRDALARGIIGTAVTAYLRDGDAAQPLDAPKGCDLPTDRDDPTNRDNAPETFAGWASLPVRHIEYMQRRGWRFVGLRRVDPPAVEEAHRGFFHTYERNGVRFESHFFDRTPENWERMQLHYANRHA